MGLEIYEDLNKFIIIIYLRLLMKNKILAIYTKEEEIKKFTDKLKNYSFDELDKHFHFEFSVMEKLTDERILKNIFQKFELISSVELRQNEKGQEYYGLNYELEDGTFIVFSFVLNRRNPLLINAFHVKRNYKGFIKHLKKNYGQKFIEL